MMLRLNKQGRIVSEKDRNLNGTYTERVISNVEDFSGMGVLSETDIYRKEKILRDKEQFQILETSRKLNQQKILEQKKKDKEEAFRKRVLKEQHKGKMVAHKNSTIAGLVALKTKSELKTPKTLGNANWGQYEIIHGSVLEPNINDPHRDYSRVQQGYFVGQPIGTDAGDSTHVGFWPQSGETQVAQMGSLWTDLRDKYIRPVTDPLISNVPSYVEKGLTHIIDSSTGQKYDVDPVTGQVLGPSQYQAVGANVSSAQLQKMMMYSILVVGGLTALIVVAKMFKGSKQVVIRESATA